MAGMLAKDVGIDLGTANVLIYVKGKGIVLDEPTVIALHAQTREVLAVGEDAHRMVGRAPASIQIVYPLRDGVIADFHAAECMLKHFLTRLGVRGWFAAKPRVLICCPTGITSVEQKAIREAALHSGGRTVYMEEEPKVAAIGAGMDIFQPSGNMVIDVGGGTADIAVLSMGGIVTSRSIRTAGNAFDALLVQYARKEYGLYIGDRTAEDIKKTIGAVFGAEKDDMMEVRGRDAVTGLPRLVSISAFEVQAVLAEAVGEIVDAARAVLEATPPELAADIIDRGIFLTGGGARLRGFDQLLALKLGVPVAIAEDPMGSVARGAGVLLDTIGRNKKPV